MTKPAPINWQETLTGEMLLLSMAGRIFYVYPEKAERTWLQSLIDEEIFSEAPFATKKEETIAGLKLLQRWGDDGLADEGFEKIQLDYTRLFIGPGKLIAAPWESVYFDEERLTFQEQTLDVRNWYRRFGLEAERKYHEPDDHIGLELLFLAHLATLGLRALEEKDNARFEELKEAQREFLQKHPGAWVLTWCGLVEANARTDLYKGVAYLIQGALAALSEVLDVKLAKDIAL